MRVLGQLFAFLILVGLAVKYWWLIVLVVAVVVAVRSGLGAWRRHRADAAAERGRLAAIVARADEQHQWVMAGDERGVFGG